MVRKGEVMVDKSALGEKILNRLRLHQQGLAQQQQQLDTRMKEMLEEREKLSAVSRRWVDEVIRPRMEELKSHFDNCMVEESTTNTILSCACNFTHTIRFPATVRLSFVLFPNASSVTVRYNLSIFPMLMEYTHNLDQTFSPETANGTLAGWVEDRLMDFVDTYLRLETDPLYQKDNTVTDIICGMKIPAISATSKIERDGRTFYFCSEHCRNIFLKQNN